MMDMHIMLFWPLWRQNLLDDIAVAEDQSDPLYWFRRDHYLQVELRYHF